ncbi:hypothetical protein SY83_08640 [Paenibacillus swuensis]|uniref:Uncharacterized protein n=1 Tax=Paenibacillus swuensis TaxID=1178515 RepID=A0A172THS4_9BACL|nr:GerAB/ArcD/ProY family transporter [Paenibacillus swuensis]ANE46333.1 hypothetical protein SY83_08640 [Paenibacillus swuensis]
MTQSARVRHLKPVHVIFLGQNVMVGYSVIVLPHLLSPAGHTQWWLVIMMAIIAQLTLIPMTILAGKYPELNLFEINRKLLGLWIGSVCNYAIVIYGVFQTAVVVSGYVMLVGTVSLPDMNTYLPLIALLLVVAYIVFGGIRHIARMCILSFILTGWIIYCLKWSMQKGEFTNLLPLFPLAPWEHTWTAFLSGFPSMFGFELVLFYFPYIINRKQALKHASIGLWITVLLYLSVSFAGVIYFSRWQLENVQYPLLDILKSVEFTFVERIENLGLALWLFTVVTTAAAYLWVSAKGLDGLWRKKRSLHIYLCVAAVFVIIRVPSATIIKYAYYYQYANVAGYILILWSLLLLGLHFISQRKAARHDK